MSDKRTSPSGAKKNLKRSLPSWMSSRENENSSHRRKQIDAGIDKERNKEERPDSSLDTTNFSQLLEGVVFVLSGFVNPERSVLRSQALEMGAEYQPDWNSECTLLVCAFPNTPKFRQVEADCGTIVSKEWITECYNQKKLSDIESYLLHAGKPWRRQGFSHKGDQDGQPSASMKSQKQPKPNMSNSSKKEASCPVKEHFSPSELKKWAIDDLSRTISWLESQEEKPNSTEIKKIAAEGILTCLQDAIDYLKQKKDIQGMTEQWMFIPRVVEELAKLDRTGSSLPLLSKEDLSRQAMACKQIYEMEFSNLDNGTNWIDEPDTETHDSDETIVMTEEEIDQAYSTVTSKLHEV